MPAWLIILLVVAVALAPLWQFRPSPRQRGRARLRERAALAGLYVEYRSLPAPSAPAAVGADGAEVIYYGLRLPRSPGGPRTACAWWREGDGWRGSAGSGKVPAPIATLPAWALAADIDEGSCGVYWREDAGVEAVDAIADALNAWREQAA